MDDMNRDRHYALIVNNSYMDDDLYYLNEFCALVKVTGLEVFVCTAQKVEVPNPSTYIGKGMVEYIKNIISDLNNESEHLKDNIVVVTNFPLTGTQRYNLEKKIGVPVVDRHYIILKIFELNAHSVEAKLQVDIASLTWSKNHLINKEGAFSQVTSGGGLHNKGSGEKKIALDRRKIERMINAKKEELERIKLARRNSRNKRNNSGEYKVAVVGYTNAGKSTLINNLINYANGSKEKEVLVKDQVFATLETSTREIAKFGNLKFLITDTVGFVSNLPTTLVNAFRSTLEEVKEADLIIHVVDVSDEKKEERIKVTQDVLNEIGVSDIPTIYLYNKYDLLKDKPTKLLSDDSLYCSLINNNDIEEIYHFILSNLAKNWKKEELLIPYEEDYASFSSNNYIYKMRQNKNGYECTVYLNPRTLYKFNYLLDKNS